MKRIVSIILTICFLFLGGCNLTEKTDESNTTKNDTVYKNNIKITENENHNENLSEEINKNDITEEYIAKGIDISKITNTQKNTLETYGDYTEEQKEVLKEIENTAKNYNKGISIVAYTINGKNALCYNSDMQHFSACTIKAPFILAVTKYMEENNIDENTMLTYKEKHWHGGSGKIRYAQYGTQYSIKYLINQALSISDNVAYEMLADYFGHEYQNNLMRELGCEGLVTNGLWTSRCTAKEFVIIWNEIYNYFETNSKYANIFKEACTNTVFNYACKNVKEWNYSHKSGDYFGDNPAYNDACIIWKERPYILVIFTKSEGHTYDTNTINKIADLIHFKLF